VRVNPTGNPGMATGGTGDVLSGMVGAFLAQGLTPFDAASVGVLAHGLAGDAAARRWGRLGLIASDLTPALGGVWTAWGRGASPRRHPRRPGRSARRSDACATQADSAGWRASSARERPSPP